MAAVPARPTFPTAPGDGTVEFTFVRGKTTLRTLRSTYPLKLMHLRGTTRTAAAGEEELPGAEWVYMLGHGGGMVSGDVIRVKVRVGDGCTAVMTTQSFTKVFHQHKGQVARQVMRAEVGAGALLAVLPDPIVPFKDSRFSQHQEFDLAASVPALAGTDTARGGPAVESGLAGEGGSLVLIDWLTSGRRARGESWDMECYESVNQVRVANKLVLHDTLRLARDPMNRSIRERMQPFHCVAMVVLIGPRTRELGKYLSNLIATRQTEHVTVDDPKGDGVGNKRRRHPGEGEEAPWDGLICSSSEIADHGGLVVRVAGHDYEMVESFLRRHLKGLEDQCGRDVWTQKMSMH